MDYEILKEMEDHLKQVNRNQWLPVYIGVGVVVLTAVVIAVLILVH